MDLEADTLQGLTRDQLGRLKLSVGKTTRARRPYSPVEVGELCQRCIDNGVDKKELTSAIGLSAAGTFPKLLKLHNALDHRIKHEVDWGSSNATGIGFSVAAEIATIDSCSQLEVAHATKKHRLRRDEVRSIKQLLERSGDDLEACITRVIKRRTTSVVREVLIGAVTSKRVETHLQDMTQLKRNELLQKVVCELLNTTEDWKFSAMLGPNSFTIISSSGFKAIIDADATFESRINKQLEELNTE